MFKRLAIIFVLLSATIFANETAEPLFSRTRHKAALLALLAYNPTPALKKEFVWQRAYLLSLLQMFVSEGGYCYQQTPKIFASENTAAEQVGLLIRELDNKPPANARPGTLQIVSAIALAYAVPTPSGVYASVHGARLVEADLQNDACARAAYSLLVHIIEGKIENQEELLKITAINADDENVAKEIRALRLREWRKLPDEKTGVGRLCRVLHIWQRAKNWRDAERSSRDLLRYTESRRFLAVLCAAWFDLPNLPEDLVWDSLRDRETRELCTDLYSLSTSEMLITVPKDLVERELTPQENTILVTAPHENTDDEIEILPITPRAPPLPQLPTIPQMLPQANNDERTLNIPLTPLTPTTPMTEVAPIEDYASNSYPLL